MYIQDVKLKYFYLHHWFSVQFYFTLSCRKVMIFLFRFKGGVSLLQAESINLCESYGKQEIIPTKNSCEKIGTGNCLNMALYRPLGIFAPLFENFA